ncbi:hypothetical protein AUJ46_01070 [Candidatus Peregrinibacteria bacterium CG1_02_54_53]|nr:MAG: hypothetical protein AUJ46_01070 [Candidatus Peregrinibacteria bacterium CG1_02_54_53]
MSTHETYNTSDLPQASFLHAAGIPLVKIERIDERRSEFQFEHTADIQKLLQIFASGREVSMVPSRLLASHKHLKSLLWSQP